MQNHWKAAAGFVAGAIVAYLGAKDGGVTSQEWLQVVLAGLGGSGLVYVAPKNKPKGQRGAADIGLGLLVVAVIGIVLLLFGVHLNR